MLRKLSRQAKLVICAIGNDGTGQYRSPGIVCRSGRSGKENSHLMAELVKRTEGEEMQKIIYIKPEISVNEVLVTTQKKTKTIPPK